MLLYAVANNERKNRLEEENLEIIFITTYETLLANFTQSRKTNSWITFALDFSELSHKPKSK